MSSDRPSPKVPESLLLRIPRPPRGLIASDEPALSYRTGHRRERDRDEKPFKHL
jgi:hypothetical protein